MIGSFQDIVDETKLLIAKYCPEWTNHNLSDPGVALIELFAWMSETLLYRLNQVPDRFYTKFLELMGIAPFPPTAAQADLTFWLSTVLDSTGDGKGRDPGRRPCIGRRSSDIRDSRGPGHRPARTDRGQDRTGRLEHGDARDAWDDLRFSGAPCCGASPPSLGLSRATPLPGLRLQSGRHCGAVQGDHHQLRPASGFTRRGRRLYLEAWSGEAWVTVPAIIPTPPGVSTGTARSSLLFPHAHEALALGGTRAYWFRVVMTQTTPGEPSYQASPEIRPHGEPWAGPSLAEHSVRYGPESLGRSNGLPGQSFLLRHAPVLARRDGEHRSGNYAAISSATGTRSRISPARLPERRALCTRRQLRHGPFRPARSATQTGAGTSTERSAGRRRDHHAGLPSWRRFWGQRGGGDA